MSTKVPADFLLFWDIDGTIIPISNKADSNHAKAVARASGKKIVEPEIFPGMTDYEILHIVFRANQIVPTATAFERAMRELEGLSELDLSNSNPQPMAGVRALVQYAQFKGWKNSLFTGNTRQRAYSKISSAGISHHFDSASGFFGDRAENRMALADDLRGYLRKRPYVRGVIIGDTPQDVRAARRAGLPVLALATGKSSVFELSKSNPDLVVASLEGSIEIVTAFLESISLSRN